jgi:hypothetical protein
MLPGGAGRRARQRMQVHKDSLSSFMVAAGFSLRLNDRMDGEKRRLKPAATKDYAVYLLKS